MRSSMFLSWYSGYFWKCTHSTRFSGGAPTPFVIPLQLCSHTAILGHHLQRPSDQRVTHAQRSPPDPRKPHHHCRFPERSDVLSPSWRWQGVPRTDLPLKKALEFPILSNISTSCM